MIGLFAAVFVGVLLVPEININYPPTTALTFIMGDDVKKDDSLLILQCTPLVNTGRMYFYHSSVTPYTDPEQHYTVRWQPIKGGFPTEEDCHLSSLARVWYPGVHYFMVEHWSDSNPDNGIKGKLLGISNHIKMIVVDPNKGPKPLSPKLKLE